MGFRELLRTAFEAVSRNRLRSALTALGVVISVATIIGVVAVVMGINHLVMGSIPLKPDTFVVTRFGIIMGRDEFLAALKRKHITEEDAQKVRELCESCKDIAVETDASRSVRTGARRIPGVQISGSTANFAEVQGIDLEAGRWFTELEDQHRAPVTVIGSEIREELFPHVDPLGRTVWIGPVPHTVIGLLPKQGTVLGNNRDLVAYVPFATLRKQVGRKHGTFDSGVTLFIRPWGGIPGVKQAEEEVQRIFRWLRHTPLKASDPVGIVTQEVLQTTFRQLTFATFAFVVALASISLFVGGLVVANIMLVSVVERTREIGVRLALGARKRDIRWQFLFEAAMLTVAGGAIGVAVGGLIAWMVRENTPLPAIVRLDIAVIAVIAAIFAGLAAGFFPARRAANLTPVEALRDE